MRTFAMRSVAGKYIKYKHVMQANLEHYSAVAKKIASAE
jgi:hypothetical protein